MKTLPVDPPLLPLGANSLPKPTLKVGPVEGTTPPRDGHESLAEDSKTGLVLAPPIRNLRAGWDLQPLHTPTVSPSLASELSRFSWGGAGFIPPDTPDYDARFLKRTKDYPRTYSESPFRDGIYYGAISRTRDERPRSFWCDLHFDIGPDAATLIELDGWRWTDSKRVLTRFDSVFASGDVYHRLLRLPGSLFSNTFDEWATCPEVSVFPDYDTAYAGAIDTFNSRVYCRTGRESLAFVGRMTFRWIPTSR